MKISTHFCSEEFLPKEMHNDIVSLGLDPRWFIRKEVVDFCEWLRSKFEGKELLINNWKWSGRYNESGLRNPATTIGAKYSQHKFKDAVDIKIKDVAPSEIREVLLENFEYLNTTFGFSTIERVSDTPTWIHCDFRWTGLPYLLEVRGK